MLRKLFKSKNSHFNLSVLKKENPLYKMYKKNFNNCKTDKDKFHFENNMNLIILKESVLYYKNRIKYDTETIMLFRQAFDLFKTVLKKYETIDAEKSSKFLRNMLKEHKKHNHKILKISHNKELIDFINNISSKITKKTNELKEKFMVKD